MDDGPRSAVFMSALKKEIPVYVPVYKTLNITISAVFFFVLLQNNNHVILIVSVASVPVVVTCSYTIRSEDAGSIFIRNVGKHIPGCTMTLPQKTKKLYVVRPNKMHTFIH
jgi:hypothetical protein